MARRKRYSESDYKEFIYKGLPMRIAPNGDFKIPAITRVLLPIECKDESFFREFLQFLLDNCPDLPEKDRELTLKRMRGEYVKW